MQKVTTYNLPALNANPVTVRCTMVTRKMSVQESAAADANFQGVTMRLGVSNGFGQVTWGDWFTIAKDALLEPYVIEGAPNDHDPNAPPLGNGGSSPYPVSPGGPVTQGTPVFQATSATATPTTIMVTEQQ